MSNDLVLIVGIIIAGIGVPALITSFSESRSASASILMFALGGALIAWAAIAQPGGYTVGEVPAVFARVIAKFIR
jgi:hypothetical protein